MMNAEEIERERAYLRERLWKLWMAVDDADILPKSPLKGKVWAAKMDISDAIDALDKVPDHMPKDAS